MSPEKSFSFLGFCIYTACNTVRQLLSLGHTNNTRQPKGNKMNKPKITADAAYENAHLVAQDMIAKLAEVLFEMPAPGDDTASPINWGHVGTLNEVNARLTDLIKFVKNED
jgi:hypothetical protein